MHILLIGVLAGALFWSFDQIALGYNSMVISGLVSVPAQETMEVCRYAVWAYAPLCMIFAVVGAILVANARSEINSPLITTSSAGTISAFGTILLATVLNVYTIPVADAIIIPIASALQVTTGSIYDVSWLTGNFFRLVHYGSIIMIVIGYLYMIYTSLKIESLEWSL